ncbi:ATP-binding protein [Streptomyces sp. NPDC001889]
MKSLFLRRGPRRRHGSAPLSVARDLAQWRSRLRRRYLTVSLAGAGVPSAVWGTVETVGTVSPLWPVAGVAAAGAAILVLGRRWAGGDAACVAAGLAAERAAAGQDAQALRRQMAGVYEWMTWYASVLAKGHHDLAAALGTAAPAPSRLAAPAPPDAFTGLDHALAAVLGEAVEAVALARTQGAAEGEKALIKSIAPRLHALISKALNELEALEAELDGPEMRMAYRVDHHSTRVRHYIESLMVLSGTPFASSRDPVLLSTVLRSAIAETESFKRATPYWPREELWIAPYAGPGITHLLAALIDNAMRYSQHEVRVEARWDGDALLITVEDRGLPMTEQALADANALLSAPDQAVERERLHRGLIGLAVVARLAKSYELRVELSANPEPEEGHTASVWLPRRLVTTAPEAPPFLRRTAHRPLQVPQSAPDTSAATPVRERPDLPPRIPAATSAARETQPGEDSPSGDRPRLPRRSRPLPSPEPAFPATAPPGTPAAATPQLVHAFRTGARRAADSNSGAQPPADPGLPAHHTP